MYCQLPDAHEGPEEAEFCESSEHQPCAFGTVGCSSLHTKFSDCETY